MFFISKCRVKSDLGVCMTSVLAKRIRLRSANFRRILRPNTFLNWKSALYGRILFASTKGMHRTRCDFPLHIDIKNIYQICTKNEISSARRLLLFVWVCFPQPWSSDGRRFAASRSRLNYYEPLRSFPAEQIRICDRWKFYFETVRGNRSFLPDGPEYHGQWWQINCIEHVLELWQYFTNLACLCQCLCISMCLCRLDDQHIFMWNIILQRVQKTSRQYKVQTTTLLQKMKSQLKAWAWYF